MTTNKPNKQNLSDHSASEWSGLHRPSKDSAEIGIIHADSEIETIDSILTERLSGDYNLYRDVLIDSTVFGTWTQRQTALTKLERQVLPANEDDAKEVEAAEFIKQQLENINIDRILKTMQWGVYYGFAVGELMWGVADNKVVLKDIKVRDRTHFKFGKKGELVFIADGDDKTLPPRKFWTYSAGGDTTDNPYGLGLAHFLFWPVLFKKSNVKFWLVGNEKAATSTPHGQFDPKSPTVESDKRLLATALNAIRNGSSTISPIGTKIELLKGESGAVDYEKLCRYMDEAIALINLGQVMTSQAVGGQYKADVQNEVKDDIVKADADLLCASLNDTVIKWLCEWNFPGVTPPKLWLLTKDETDEQLQTQSYANMAKVGYRPTLDTVSEVLGGEWEEIPSSATESASNEEATKETKKAKPLNDKESTPSNEEQKKEMDDEKLPPTNDFSEKIHLDPQHIKDIFSSGWQDLVVKYGLDNSNSGKDFTGAAEKDSEAVIDDLFGLSDAELNLLLAKEAQTLSSLRAENREELATKLLNAYPDLSFSELQNFLSKAIFIASIIGDSDAGEGE